jgi:formylglycine-generating enzyme required for sulfatase activity
MRTTTVVRTSHFLVLLAGCGIFAGKTEAPEGAPSPAGPGDGGGADSGDGADGAGGNEPPGTATVVLSPERPTTLEEIEVVIVAAAADPDGDAVTYRYVWFEDGVLRADLTGDALLAAETAKGQVWEVNVIANDGRADGGVAVAEATVVNTPPSVVASLDSVARTTDALVARVASDDADADSVSFSYLWTVDGRVTPWVTDTVPASATARGERWAVSVTPNDGEVDGAPATASVTVENTLPTVDSVSLGPSPAFEGTTLRATPSGAADADGDPLSFAYTWLVNGAPVSGVTGDTLTGAHFNKGDRVAVRVELSDPVGAGGSAESAELVIANSPPNGAGVSLSPRPAFEGSSLRCVPSGWADDDGDPEAWLFAWRVNGAAAGSGSGLTGAVFNKGDSVACVATPDDGDTLGVPLTSAALVVSNTPPTLASVALSTLSPLAGETLSVALGTAADADGDPVTVTYAWSVNGSVVSASPTLSPSLFGSGDRVFVTVTPFDGTDAGTPAISGTVVVANSLPLIGSVSLSPTLAYETSTMTATVSGALDPDGDALTFIYAWYVNGVVVRSGGTSTLTGLDFDKGDVVQARVTPFDGAGLGTTISSGSVTVQNSVPSGTSVAISPAALAAGLTASCLPAGWSDADGGAEAWRYAWRVNGGAAGSAATLSSASFNKGDSVVCVATPDDGEGLGAPLTSAAVTVANTPPTLASVALSTLSPTESDPLSVVLGAIADADGDTASVRYAWTVNGVVVASSPTLAASFFARGDSVQVTVTPYDGTMAGAAVSSEVATVANSAPTIGPVSLSPATVYTDGTLTASATGSDLDGDTVSLSYAWTVNGSAVSASGSSLSGVLYFDRGDTVQVTVTPSDGVAFGASRSGSVVTVQNTAPTRPVVAISPSDPMEGEALVCEVLSASGDTDGDSLTYSISWDVDGVAYTDAADGALVGDTVLAGEALAGETWTCAVAADDGAVSGIAASDSVDVEAACGDGSVTLTASGIEFVTICGGSFNMGCTPGQSSCNSDESPVMPVTLTRDYYLGRTEVTQGQFQALMGYNPSYFTACGSSCPVERVSWHEAAAFANAVSAAAGLSECYSCIGSGTGVWCSAAVAPSACPGYRLPTEAEWEGAARCGEDLLYAGSASILTVAWYSSNSGSTPHPVGGWAPNACGLYDMTGNILEWAQDWLYEAYYLSAGRTDPAGAASGFTRVARGGCWGDVPQSARVATRSGLEPGFRDRTLGFRLLRTAP